MENIKHIPVMVEQVVEGLAVKNGGVYIDGTVGYGGHLKALLKSGNKLTIIGLDKDEKALEEIKKTLKKKENIYLFHSSYKDASEILNQLGIKDVDGILLDLGASSPQFDNPERGFSLKKDGRLDMRFDSDGDNKTAADILNTYPPDRLKKIFFEYGEERHAGRIAEAIVKERKRNKFLSTKQLRDIVAQVVPKRKLSKTIDPATRVFQALRIEVNDELNELKQSLPRLFGLLKPGARLAVISFHSLEDRIVKHFFKDLAKDCVCPKELPICRCEKVPVAEIITKKPIIPSKIQIKNNVRCRSAKLRIVEHL